MTVPFPVTSLDLCAVRAYVEVDDGDLIVIVHDTEVAVRLEPASGAGTWASQSAFGAERVASVLTEYAEQIRVEAGLPPGKARAAWHRIGCGLLMLSALVVVLAAQVAVVLVWHR